MAKSRTKNTAYSMAGNAVFYGVNIVLGIINRRILIDSMGIEYQGVNGLFSSVLSMLGMAELGIGTAIIFHLYKPLADDDRERICSIMSFYKKCYGAIAVFLLLLGSVLCMNIEFFVEATDLPLNLQLVFMLMLAEVVASYSFTYKRSILYADQKNYIVANVNTLFVIFYNGAQILVLYLTRSYYWYLAVKFISRLLENALINLLVNRSYPYLKNGKSRPLEKDILKDIVQKVKGLMFHKIGTFVVNGTDNIFISKLIGIAAVGIYTNYNYILTAVNSLLNQLLEGASGSVGNLLVKAEKDYRLKIFKEMNLLNQYLSTTAIVIFAAVADDTIALLFGREYIIRPAVFYVLVLNMILVNQRRVWGIVKTAAGIQYEDRFVPIWESMVNVAASLLFYYFFGFEGIFMGTLFTHLGVFCYTFPVLVYQQVLGGSRKGYIGYMVREFSYQLFTVVIGMLACHGKNTADIWLRIGFGVLAGFVWSTVSFLCVYGRKAEFKDLASRIRLMIGRKEW